MFGDCDYGLCLNYNDVSHVKSAGKPKKILEIKLGKFWRCRAYGAILIHLLSILTLHQAQGFDKQKVKFFIQRNVNIFLSLV